MLLESYVPPALQEALKAKGFVLSNQSVEVDWRYTHPEVTEEWRRLNETSAYSDDIIDITVYGGVVTKCEIRLCCDATRLESLLRGDALDQRR